jgi:hypothetical protein
MLEECSSSLYSIDTLSIKKRDLVDDETSHSYYIALACHITILAVRHTPVSSTGLK